MLQTKLTINQPGDAYEQEADRVADQVMRMPEPQVQRACAACEEEMQRQPLDEEEEELQMQAAGPAPAAPATAPPIVQSVLNAPGRPLDAGTRAFMEPRFGQSFGHVRVHTGAQAAESARSVNARAYTVGRNMVFGAGQYAPETSAGQQLLAHELTHVLQQQQSKQATIQRIPLPASGDTAEQESSPADAASQVDSAREEFDLSTPVQRMVVSCTDDLIFFETLTTVYVYRLTECTIPEGTYETTVRKPYEENGQRFDIFWQFRPGDIEPGREATFNYAIRRDQENPATLFDDGQAVTIEVVPSISLPPTREPSSACRVRVPDEVLIPATDIEEQLFEQLSFNEEIWSQTIPLGQFGWGDVNLVARGSATGQLLGGYGPGVLRNICLIRTLDAERLAGQAEFSMEGNIGPEITLDGSVKLEGRYLSIIPVAAIEGGLTAIARARVQGRVAARFEVIYDHVNDEWSLVADGLISGGAALGFEVQARAAVQFLGSDLWSETWRLVDAEIGFDWQGGLRVGPGRQISFINGSVGGQGMGIQSAASGGASGGGAGGGGTFTLPLVQILQALLEHDPEDTEQTTASLTGRTRRDPIPMIWYKPYDEYPRAVILADEEVFRFGEAPRQYVLPDPDIVTRGGRGAADLRRYLEGGNTITVGVDPALIPTDERVNSLDEGLVWKKVRSYRRALGGQVQRAFRFLMIAHGHDMRARNEDADHVKDLQFQGPDDFNNMWPLNSGVNQSSQRFAEQTVTYTDDSGNPQTTQLDDPVLLSRWFRIVGFQLF